MTDTRNYRPVELQRLAGLLTTKQLRQALRGSYRTVGRAVLPVARAELQAAAIYPSAGASDWTKGVRQYNYSKGGGFLVTVKGSRGKSMHRNRFGQLKPVLMWAEEGTAERSTRGGWRRRAHATGRMPRLGFLEKAAPEMYSRAEREMLPAVERAVERVARKAGLS